MLDDQMAETKIIDIEWNVSKDGLIKPVLILEPVNIGGVTITRVTGNDAKNIIDNKCFCNIKLHFFSIYFT